MPALSVYFAALEVLRDRAGYAAYRATRGYSATVNRVIFGDFYASLIEDNVAPGIVEHLAQYVSDEIEAQTDPSVPHKVYNVSADGVPRCVGSILPRAKRSALGYGIQSWSLPEYDERIDGKRKKDDPLYVSEGDKQRAALYIDCGDDREDILFPKH